MGFQASLPRLPTWGPELSLPASPLYCRRQEQAIWNQARTWLPTYSNWSDVPERSPFPSHSTLVTVPKILPFDLKGFVFKCSVMYQAFTPLCKQKLQTIFLL